jgi:hypothetical protein
MIAGSFGDASQALLDSYRSERCTKEWPHDGRLGAVKSRPDCMPEGILQRRQWKSS